MALITLDEYKVVEGIASSTQDDRLEPILNSASAFIETYCSNKFLDYAGSPGFTQLFDIQWATHVVQLKYSPIIQIASVEHRTAQSVAYTQLYTNGGGSPAAYDWYFDSVTDSILRTNEAGAYCDWPLGVGSVRVTYNSGYTVLPLDLKMALIDLTTYIYKDEHKILRSLGTATMQNQPSSSITNDVSLPDHIKRVLDLYKL